jgi:glycosyltransferase involved in cell wall biosynthesis
VSVAPVRPAVSVVVPTHDRPAGLAAVLAALHGQTLAPERFEVIVVDDGSEPPQAAHADGLALRTVRHERARGPAAARNTGWRVARAPLVAFTDDDCTPEPGWLEALLDAAAGRSDVVVQGPVAPPPGQAPSGPLEHTIEIGAANRLFVTCNIAYPRPLLDRLGGFDESFLRACGEDLDLGTRATKAGADVVFAQRALVRHEVRQMTLGQALRHVAKWTDAVRVLSLHPELRDLLALRVFWKPAHAHLLVAAGGLLARRRLVMAAAALPYLVHHRRRYGGDVRAAARALPAHAVLDVGELATMVRGSLRHRTLML